MHTRRILLWSLLLGLVSCGQLRIETTSSTQAVPADLQGRWLGSWQSDTLATAGSSANGAVEVRIQEFAGEPVVMLDLDNPCLPPRSYELVLSVAQIELQADGVTVLEASRTEQQKLEGTYTCAEDQGTWSVQWVEALPTLLDLSGEWQGRIYGQGQTEQPIVVDLQQGVEGGALVLAGFADLPGALPFELPLQGYVRFVADRFELVLQTDPGFEPQLIVSGIGDREPLQLPVGLVQVISPTGLPFSQALVELVRQE